MVNFFSKYKFIFYLSNFFLIVSYLFPGSILGWFLYGDFSLQPQITPDYIVSTNHLYAFLLLSIIGFFTFKNWNQFFPLCLYLISLSVFLELIHLIMPTRSFEFPDLFGNITGVIIVIIISYYLKKT